MDSAADTSGVTARRARLARGEAPPTERATGTLDAENRLFERALREEREGDRDAARATLEELLRDYPKTPLAPDARRALGRLRAPRPTP
jgi:TolA-binding protein